MKLKWQLPLFGVTLISGLFLFSSKLTATPTGEGTEENPYLISTEEELNQFRIAVNGGNDFAGVYFKLNNDLDFEGFDDDGDSSNGNFTPIGTSSTPFRGYFDGGYHTISNLDVKGNYYGIYGLFNYKEDGWIKHLVLKNLTVKSQNISYNSDYTGGGLIAEAKNTVIEEVAIINGNLKRGGYDRVGGMVGKANATTIKNSYVQADIDVSRSAGLIYSGTDSVVENCYFTGKMTSAWPSGLIQEGSGNTVTHSYWDTTTSGATSSTGGGKGVTKEVLITQSTSLTLDGFKDNPIWKVFDTETDAIQFPILAWQNPILGDDQYAGGTGHKNNPYLISTVEQFDHFAQQINDGDDYAGAYFKLNNDLDFTGFDDDGDTSNGNFTPIGTSTTPFRGHFDGGYHTISNLDVKGNYYGIYGLFNYKEDGWIKHLVLKNLTVKSQNISYNSNYIGGGLISEAKNTLIEEVAIIDSSLHGGYSSYDYLGGMIGKANSTTIKNSYVQVDLKARRTAGLIYESINSVIENSYYTGKMSPSSTSDRKGLVYTGATTVTNGYWDSTISGTTTTTGGGTPLTTEQFETYTQTKTLPGFDFRNIWTNTPESPYPVFKRKPLRPGTEESDMTVTGNVQPLVLSMDVPTSEATFVLNPNGLTDQQFVAPTFIFNNQSNSPLTMELKEFVQTTDVMTDVLSNHFDTWQGLNKTESKNMALALTPVEGNGWEEILKSEHYVAENINDTIGIIHPHQQVELTFKAFHGTAFNEPLLPSYRLTFVFGLKD